MRSRSPLTVVELAELDGLGAFVAGRLHVVERCVPGKTEWLFAGEFKTRKGAHAHAAKKHGSRGWSYRARDYVPEEGRKRKRRSKRKKETEPARYVRIMYGHGRKSPWRLVVRVRDDGFLERLNRGL